MRPRKRILPSISTTGTHVEKLVQRRVAVDVHFDRRRQAVAMLLECLASQIAQMAARARIEHDPVKPDAVVSRLPVRAVSFRVGSGSPSKYQPDPKDSSPIATHRPRSVYQERGRLTGKPKARSAAKRLRTAIPRNRSTDPSPERKRSRDDASIFSSSTVIWLIGRLMSCMSEL